MRCGPAALARPGHLRAPDRGVREDLPAAARRAPGLRVIATSREPMRVAAETVWQVPPLSLPSPPAARPARTAAYPVRPEPIADSDALRLFADRAAAAEPGFTLTVANLAAVTRSAARVDGLPLASSWRRLGAGADRRADRRPASRPIPVAQLRRPDAPRGIARSRAAIDWSHELLSPPEKVLLRRLSSSPAGRLRWLSRSVPGPALNQPAPDRRTGPSAAS